MNKPVLIKHYEDDGEDYVARWGVSLSDSNPEPEDYIGCASKEDALKLHRLLLNLWLYQQEESTEPAGVAS